MSGIFKVKEKFNETVEVIQLRLAVISLKINDI